MLTARPVLRGREQQVSLPAKKCGDLQHVHRFGHALAVGRLVHVGDHRKPGSLGDPAQDAAPCSNPGPRKPAAEVRFALSYEALKM